MCYNLAKSSHIGLYSLKSTLLDFYEPRDGIIGDTVGIDNYEHPKSDGNFVNITVPGESEDIFIGFNDKSGINADTREAVDQITVAGQFQDNASNLRAKLDVGEQYIKSNFMGDGKPCNQGSCN
mmetsp:Transcript_25606/g.73681  ORF Transcript_25606/g.73681 Transcript_25606/m.73681 type:complete len:124 (+) Transcript_25606:369-740(+)